jgi:hypothetical protein
VCALEVRRQQLSGEKAIQEYGRDLVRTLTRGSEPAELREEVNPKSPRADGADR